ncbi:MAG: cytochrome c3 family protein [Deltaproteobacteria bacterium]|nr:cytochrome c3 family protein [Deltaproteobacteria bacterium]MBW1846937.1 cytochrome c3 family protein [Deltaproteobacteria bacterium]MBW1983662.1 cytochrome c3 family protein [Deltaproteobacteria bacterium]MBW2179398.1 cytochrome c3 family protein [Deltaproteobacteria bacterium]MBW2364481.1 cytochrome c3 family protein [Deltaproteobacteria bacterium]
MKNKWIYTKRVFLALICAAVLFIGCSPEKEMDISQDKSKAQQPEETKPVEDSKAEADSSETITIYAQLFTEHTKGPVKFTHDKHSKEYKVACNDCHHIYENGKNVWKEGMEVDKCEVCHNEPTVKREKTLSPDVQKKNLKLAFHNNCRACHRKIKSEDPAIKAPTTCSGCHDKLN